MIEIPTLAGDGVPARPPYIPLSVRGAVLAGLSPAAIDAADTDTLNGLFAVMVSGYRMLPMPLEAEGQVIPQDRCRPMLCPPGAAWGINYSIPNPCGRFGTLKQVRALAGEYGAAVVLHLASTGMVQVCIGFESMAALAAARLLAEGVKAEAEPMAGLSDEFVSLVRAQAEGVDAIPVTLVKAALGFLLCPAAGDLWANALKADQAQQAAWQARAKATEGGAP